MNDAAHNHRKDDTRLTARLLPAAVALGLAFLVAHIFISADSDSAAASHTYCSFDPISGTQCWNGYHSPTTTRAPDPTTTLVNVTAPNDTNPWNTPGDGGDCIQGLCSGFVAPTTAQNTQQATQIQQQATPQVQQQATQIQQQATPQIQQQIQIQQQQQVQPPTTTTQPPLPASPTNSLSTVVCNTSVSTARYEFTVNPALPTGSTTYKNTAGTLWIQTRQQWKWNTETDSSYRTITSTGTRRYQVNGATGKEIVIRVQSRARQAGAGSTLWGSWGNAGVSGAWYTNSSASECVKQGAQIVGSTYYTYGQKNVWLDALADDYDKNGNKCVSGNKTSSWCAGSETAMSLRISSTSPTTAKASASWSYSIKTSARLGIAYTTPSDWSPGDSVTFTYCVTFIGHTNEACGTETLFHGGISAPRNLHTGLGLGPDWFEVCWFKPEFNGASDSAVRYEVQVFRDNKWTPVHSSLLTTHPAASLASTKCDP